MSSVKLQLGLAFIIGLGLASFASAQLPATDVYYAKQIWTGTGEPISDGALVVQNGVVVAAGAKDSVSIPDNAKTHDLGAQIIVPGFVAAQTSLAGGQAENKTITPGVRAVYGFDLFAERDQLLEAGLTTVQVSPGGGRLMPGVGGVVRLAGDLEDRVLNETESLRIVLDDSIRNPPRIYEPPVGPVSDDRPLLPTRPQLAKLTTSIAGLRQIFLAATGKETAVSTEGDEIVSAVAELLKAETPVRITARTAPEIRGAINLAKEFEFELILVDAAELKTFVSQFRDWGKFVRGVILSGPGFGKISNPSAEQIKNQDQPWDYARELLDSGIPVAIKTGSDSDLAQLTFVAGHFMKDGLSASELLAAITSVPAKLMGVEKRIGSLNKGQIADFVVLDRPPFSIGSKVMATYVSGKPAFSRQLGGTTTVVRASQIYLGDGHVLNDANILVKGKTVRGIGSSVSAPADANIKFYDDAVIVPGFIDMGSTLGVGGPLSGNISLATKLGEQLYPDDPAIDFARRNGITTVLMGTPSGSASPLVAFKLTDEQRVIGDPIAVRFKFSSDTAASIASNEKLLAAGKKYADSWTKYAKDLAEYEKKVKEAAAKEKAKPAAKKAPEKPAEKKAEKKADAKKDEKEKGDKKETEEKKEKPKPEEKKDEDKEEDKEEEVVLPDPVTGTWEGSLESERLPPQFRQISMELELIDSEVTGTFFAFRQELELNGTFDRNSNELKFSMTIRDQEVSGSGTIAQDGNFTGFVEFGPLGKVDLVATRTVDKSKKPEPKPEKEKEKDKPAPEKDKPKPGDKPKPKPEEKDKPKEDPKKEKPAEGDKKEDAKKDESADAKKQAESKDKKEEPKPELKAPKKPKESAALEPYRQMFAGKLPAFVEAKDLNGIKAAAELFSKKYGVKTVIVGADDLARDPEILADYDVSVIAGPALNVAIDKETTNLPQLLSNEQLTFGFQSHGTTGTGQLPAAVQFSVHQGLSTGDAVRGLTGGPAQMLASGVNFGTLQSGKDADLVVLSGAPFEYSTKVLAVMIDGVWVYERKE